MSQQKHRNPICNHNNILLYNYTNHNKLIFNSESRSVKKCIGYKAEICQDQYKEGTGQDKYREVICQLFNNVGY